MSTRTKAGPSKAGTAPPDQSQRDAAIAERARNVMIDAGAGTGKTTTIVRRLVHLLAPTDGHEPIDIERIAAVTFTRRAAGELRLKVREQLFAQLSAPKLSAERRRTLERALSGLDTAHIGTVHSFADRLLRLKPVEAELSPVYEIADDVDALIRETYDRLLRGAEMGTLPDELGGLVDRKLINEGARTLIDAVALGIRAEKQEWEFFARHGLDSLIEGFILHRDCPPMGFERPPKLDRKALSKAMRLLKRSCTDLQGSDHFCSGIRQLADSASELTDDSDAMDFFRALVARVQQLVKTRIRQKDCEDDSEWELYKSFTREHKETGAPSIADQLSAPLYAWMAQRLVRLFPVVIALYDKVKGRQGVVDQVDLLLQLRDLLQRDKQARAFYQDLFDHIFVDEFQDTDPLQAEVIAYLCEQGAKANTWNKVKLTPGKLTVVGDPKQSIYRFRRADVAIYDEMRRLLAPTSLQIELSTNFRSTPQLIDWLNARMDPLLGSAPDGDGSSKRFDAASGQVFHQPLAAGTAKAKGPAVHMVPLQQAEDGDERAEAYRLLEAAAMARYLRWLVDHSGHQVRDLETGQLRPVQFGDIAVLSLATSHLAMLSRELDTFAVPHTLSGGKLFLEDPLHQQLLLALRALSDPDDGVAEAALLRPPFFAVDLADHYQRRAEESGEGVQRLELAREQVRELRRRRFERSPGATARALLDETAFARTVALGPNGEQRLRRLRELCHLLELEAAEDGLDYDGVTAVMRAWLDAPPQIDAPRPVENTAVQVMTVHQAKGLEFPVVVLWDSMAQLAGRSDKPPWRVLRDSGQWALALDGLEHSEPPEADLAGVEKTYRGHERRRVIYVACTRARDLLILPRAAEAKEDKHVTAMLLAEEPKNTVQRLDVFNPDKLPRWAAGVSEPKAAKPKVADKLERKAAQRWEAALGEAAKPRTQPRYVTEVAKGRAVDEDAEPRKRREGRFGAAFGTVVHRAIELCFAAEGVAVAAAVEQAAREVGLGENLEEARGDVGRAVEALRGEGIVPPAGGSVRLEYPVAGVGADGVLLLGTIDLVAVRGDQLTIIDFKTDAPPNGSVEKAMPAYVVQLCAYAALLAQKRLAPPPCKAALLFTADGSLRIAR